MSHNEPIHEISAQLGLTSRTLRHWEEKGLFKSIRDPQSGWRIYNDEAVQRIRLVLLLRELDIPIKAVKLIMESASKEIAATVIEKQISKLNQESLAIVQRKEMLGNVFLLLNQMQALQDTSRCIVDMETDTGGSNLLPQTLKNQWEEIIMKNDTITSGALRIVALPAMRVAVCNVISASPEDEALGKVLGWAKRENLMGTARIFGV